MDPDVLIRPIQLGERRQVEEFFDDNLGLIDNIIFNISLHDVQKSARKGKGTTLIATKQGKILGTVSATAREYRRRRIGHIGAIATDKKIRGQGVGKRLLDEALAWLGNQGCDTVYATADRYNSPSWNMFIHKGFRVQETFGQMREFGLDFLRLWLTEFYFIGIGLFFLRKGPQEHEPKEAGLATNLSAAWLGLTLACWMLAIRGGAQPPTLLLLLPVVGATILAHELPHRLVADYYGLETTFKTWDSGLLFNLLLSIIGGLYPAYGSTYVEKQDWPYEPPTRRMSILYAAGPASSMLLAALFQSIPLFIDNPALRSAMRSGYILNMAVAILNLLPIRAAGGFPWDGRKIFPRNKPLWILMVAAVVILILNDISLVP